MRVTRLFSALLAFIGALVLAAPAAEAATSYTLSWSAPRPKTLYLNTSLSIMWSKSAPAAPQLGRVAAGNGACKIQSTNTAAGPRYAVVRGKVADGRTGDQQCPVTIQGGTNANWFPSPVAIIHDYQALSYEPIAFAEIIPGFAEKLWCVSKCNFVDGSMRSTFRERATGYCYAVNQSYADGAGRGSPNGSGFPVECPQTVKLELKKLYAIGKFDVKAYSNLGVRVTLTSKTPSVCTVTKTDEASVHKVKGLKKGKCTLKVSSPRSTQNDHPWGRSVYMYSAATPVTASTKIGTCRRNCEPDDPLEQSIAATLPTTLYEYDVTPVSATTTSNLPVEVEVVNVNRCAYDQESNELQMLQFLDPENTADLNRTNICRVRFSQPGGDDFEPADDVIRDVVILCSAAFSCPPTPPQPPRAEPDGLTQSYGPESFSGSTRGNDFVPQGFETYTIVTSNPASGALEMNPATGEYVFRPYSEYFVGPTTFAYKLVSTNGTESATATVSITVTPPTPPAPPTAPSTAVTIRAGKWMRLNTTETISAVASGSCGSTALTNGVCGSHPDAGGIVGAYNRFSKVELTAFELTAPAGYPANRWSIVENPAIGTPSSVFSTGASAKLRFQQATASGTSFTVKLGFKLTWQSVQWTRFNGVLVETIVAEGATLAGTQSSFGVIGSTN